ncbi:hypothetical protein CBM2615_U40024 [Cupriavidus taiwanensis]|nr:hypothetical protein CBM2615_U40024 [Cupriavidus taiwanensis]SOZ75409.1 hypothetical protein CBM2613_U40025 [Cupriavidus taiwanensis]SPA12895.1 hypothetical protein CBM2625_U50028 [Cupriavidus taiwanensis]
MANFRVVDQDQVWLRHCLQQRFITKGRKLIELQLFRSVELPGSGEQ